MIIILYKFYYGSTYFYIIKSTFLEMINTF